MSDIIPFPGVEMKAAAPQTGQVEVKLTADDIRSRIVNLFTEAKPMLQQYHDYAVKAAAMNEDFHRARLTEALGLVPQDLTLAVTLDGRQTPAALDNRLAQIRASGAKIKLIAFDRVKACYHLFV